MGYALKLTATATPNTINPATNQPDPILTLFDNTTGAPVAPIPFTTPVTVTATTALNSWVSRYGTSFPALGLYVKFTHVPSWGLATSYNSVGLSNTLYATVATPTAPMAVPWVGVLDKACDWGKRISNANSATTALAKGLYDTGTYNGYITHTTWPTPHQDGVETFQVPGFLSTLKGDCRDFSDFMVCLSNAIGAKPLQSQRSASVTDIDNHTSVLETNNFVAAPWDPSLPQAESWNYHQWSTSDNVFDACIGTTATPLVNLTLTTYFSTLVDQSLPYFWKPQAPFTPTLSN